MTGSSCASDVVLPKHIKGSGIRSALRRTCQGSIDGLPDVDLGDGWLVTKPLELKPGQLPPSLVTQCLNAVQREASKLPANESEERVFKRRFPRSKSDALLKRGCNLEGVAMNAALRVIEDWMLVLKSFATAEEVPHVIAALAHGETEDAGLTLEQNEAVLSPRSSSNPDPDQTIKSKHQAVSKSPQRYWPNLGEPLVPPASHILGAALRCAVPSPHDLRQRQQRRQQKLTSSDFSTLTRPVTPAWEFFEDMQKAMELEETKGLDKSWPFTAERQALRRAAGMRNSKLSPSCVKAKEKEVQAGSKRRAPFSVNLQLRLTSDQPWANYRKSDGLRATFTSFSPQVFNSRPEPPPGDIPGPGTYTLPSFGGSQRAKYPSAGRPRTALGELTLSQSSRFGY